MRTNSRKKPARRKAKTTPTKTFFGTALRLCREDRQYRLLDLAEKLKVSLPYLSDVELGRRDPLSNARIMEAAKALGVDPLPLLESAMKDRGKFVFDGIDELHSIYHRVIARMWVELSKPSTSRRTLRVWKAFNDFVLSIEDEAAADARSTVV